MWTVTNPKRMMPVAAMTTFRPTEDAMKPWPRASAPAMLCSDLIGLGVADHVDGDEPEKDDAGGGHDHLPADRGRHETVAACFRARDALFRSDRPGCCRSCGR